MSHIAIILFLLLTSPALAGEATYLDINLASYHFQRSEVARQNLSESNPGIGIERDTGNWRQMAGVYRNSIRRTSVYALAGYTPLHIGQASIGIVGGAITGYEVPVAPALGLIASLQFERFGVNIIAVPDAHVMHKRVNGFAGFQVRYKLE